MNETPKLNYESHPPRRPLVRLPPDWRRRLVWATVAGVVVFVLTFEAARRSQSPGLIDHASRRAPLMIAILQREVDAHTANSLVAPTTIAQVPNLAKRHGPYKIDAWGRPFQLVSMGGRLTVISYGRDGVPGGTGLDTDITATTTFRDERLPLGDFLDHSPRAPLLALCGGAALVTAFMTFLPSRQNAPTPLPAMLLAALLTGASAVVIGGFMAVLHVPTGH